MSGTDTMPPAARQDDALQPAGLPVDNYTLPFWLSERSRLDQHRTTPALPLRADVAIIGSGLSGSFLSYLLLKTNPGLNVVMLEAREVCSGASARNGGQVKTDPYITYPARKAKYGAKLANELTTFETDHLQRYERLLTDEDISCSFHVTTAYDVCLAEPLATTARDAFKARAADWPIDMAQFRELSNPEELQRLSGVKDGIWGAMYRVASIWPYKLATGLLERAFDLADRGTGSFNLQTRTPVLSIESARGRHLVRTARGDIEAEKVVICTNGYTSNLLHEMTSKIVPIRGTCASLLPPALQPSGTPPADVFRPLFTSFAFKFGGGRGEYMISRQDGKKEIVIGGAKEGYLQNPALWYGNIDDSEQLPGAYEHFRQYLPKRFVNFPSSDSTVDRVWTGILGYSSDKLPWVGQVPNRPHGLYLMAGFHGHGMCRIPGTAAALSQLVLSDARGEAGYKVLKDAGLPAPYIFTPGRYASEENAIFASMGYKRPVV